MDKDMAMPTARAATADAAEPVVSGKAGIPIACNVPPEGWRCTRSPGHEGPCAAIPDEVVGHATLADGSHVPLRKSFADRLWAEAEAEREERERSMPDEQAAISQLWRAYTRLKDFGWRDPIYTRKDCALELIEPGSTGIHLGHYEGEWPTGSWWVADAGDFWPSRPVLARPAQGTEARRAATTGAVHDGPVPNGDAPKDHSHD